MHEKSLFKSDLVEVGEFTISPQDAMFSEQGCVDAPIIVFPKTCIWIQHEGSEPFVSDPTLVNFYNQGQVYQRFAISQVGDICHWFRIDDQLMVELSRKERDHFEVENTLCPANVFLSQLMLLQKVFQGNTLNVLEIEEEVIGLFQHLLFHSNKADRVFNRNQVKHQQLVEQVKATLHEDLSANLSLRQLAKIHHTSPYHLSRVFKVVNGEGINQYRKRQRLHLLSLELNSTGKGLIDLAFDYGFSSHSHMSASFRSRFGMTPSQTREQFQLH